MPRFICKQGHGHVVEPYATQPLYFGVELEVAANDDDETRAAVDAMAYLFREDEDGSIRDCDWSLELQFHPGTWTWWMQTRAKINGFLRRLRRLDCHSASDHYNCGMHVHFSNVLQAEHTLSVMQMIYAHPMQCTALSNRPLAGLQTWSRLTLEGGGMGSCSCSVCTALRARYEASMTGAYSDRTREFLRTAGSNLSSKSQAIHYSYDYPTVEVRLFSGTLDCRQFWANLEFCRALIEYTGQADFNPEMMCNWDMFHYWVNRQPRMSALKWALRQIKVVT